MVKVKKIINTLAQPLCLESGLILAAYGSEGSVRENVEITEDEQRRLGGHHVIIEYGGPSLSGAND